MWRLLTRKLAKGQVTLEQNGETRAAAPCSNALETKAQEDFFVTRGIQGKEKRSKNGSVHVEVVHREVLQASVYLGQKESDKELLISLKVTN